jgi:hypothetical protein
MSRGTPRGILWGPVPAGNSPCRPGRCCDGGLPRSHWRCFRQGMAGSQTPTGAGRQIPLLPCGQIARLAASQALTSASPVHRRRGEYETMYIGLGTIAIIVIIVLVILLLRRRV